MKKKSKPGAPVLIHPSEQERAQFAKLPTFKALDLRALFKDAKSARQTDVDAGLFKVYCGRIDAQVKELLQRLGVDPADPRALEKGFLRIAVSQWGVGHLAWYRSRTNRNASRWALEYDIMLLKGMISLTAKGLTERAAIRALAADRKKPARFPYKAWRHAAKRDASKNREDALRARWQMLKARGRDHSRLAQILGAETTNPSLSHVERVLLAHDQADMWSHLQQLATKTNQPAGVNASVTENPSPPPRA